MNSYFRLQFFCLCCKIGLTKLKKFEHKLSQARLALGSKLKGSVGSRLEKSLFGTALVDALFSDTAIEVFEAGGSLISHNTGATTRLFCPRSHVFLYQAVYRKCTRARYWLSRLLVLLNQTVLFVVSVRTPAIFTCQMIFICLCLTNADERSISKQ